MLGEELDYWESKEHHKKLVKDNFFVPYGNVAAKDYTINHPFSAKSVNSKLNSHKI